MRLPRRGARLTELLVMGVQVLSGSAFPQGAPAGGANEGDFFNLEETLNQKVITAAGKEEERTVAAADLTSVTREDISRHGWRSLAEILANTPGLYLVDDLVVPSVGVRGITGGLKAGTRIIKVMINGVPVSYRPDLTVFLGPEFIPIEAVERVEIAKGPLPLSALFGANAFLAVINVITRPVVESTSEVAVRGYAVSPSSNGAQVNPGWGGSGLFGTGDEHRSAMVAFSLDHVDRSGLRVDQTFPGQNPSLPTFAPGFNAGASHGDLAVPLSGFYQIGLSSPDSWGKLFVQGGLQQLDSMSNFGLNSVLTDQSREALQNAWSSARWDKTFSDRLSSWASVALSRGQPTRDEGLYQTGDPSILFIPQAAYWAFDAAGEVDYSTGPLFTLNLGVDGEYDHETVLFYSEVLHAAQGPYPPGSVLSLQNPNLPTSEVLSDLGAYLQVASTLGIRGLHVTGNFRLDAPAFNSLQYSWRVGATYTRNDKTVKLIVGRAFQAPSGVLLFAEPGFSSSGTSGGGDLVGNRTLSGRPPLTPQVIQSVELLTSDRITDHLAVEAGVYTQEIDSAIVFTQTAGSDFVAKNQGSQQGVGFEATARAFFGPLSPFASLTLQETSLPGQSFQLLPVMSPPPLFPNAFGVAGLNLNLARYHLNLNAQLRWAGDRGASQSNWLYNVNANPAQNGYYSLPPYADVDLAVTSAGWHFISDESETQFRLAVSNLLDEHHDEPGFGGYDLPNLGRLAWLEVRQRF